MKRLSSLQHMRLRWYLAKRRFVDDVRGVAALEFAIIAPILILLFLGTYEISTAVSVNRKMARVSSTISDLITQSPTLTSSDIDDIVKASEVIMRPYDNNMSIDDDTLKIQINGIRIEKNASDVVEAKVAWSKAYGGESVVPANTVVTVPTKIKKDGSFLVSARIKGTHVPVVGFFGYDRTVEGRLTKRTTGIDMEKIIYLRPRIGTAVSIE